MSFLFEASSYTLTPLTAKPGNESDPVLSVGMPAFNETTQLPRTLAEVTSELERLQVPFEIVVVDDGSDDGTGDLMKSLAANDRRLRLIRHETNRGIAAALATAIESSRGSLFMFIPADLALEPAAIQRYLEASADADIVAGYTGIRPDYNFYRTLVSWTNGVLLRTLFRLPIRNFNYSHLYRLSLLRRMRLKFTGSAMLYAEIFVRARRYGARIVQIPIPYRSRTGGEARGAKPALVLRTMRDMFRLWLLSVTGRLGD
jgi:glycosyltransferase involved in cell wall biosynthesis